MISRWQVHFPRDMALPDCLSNYDEMKMTAHTVGGPLPSSSEGKPCYSRDLTLSDFITFPRQCHTMDSALHRQGVTILEYTEQTIYTLLVKRKKRKCSAARCRTNKGSREASKHSDVYRCYIEASPGYTHRTSSHYAG